METITRTKDYLTRTTKEVIDLRPLKAELIEIEKQLVELDKEPDEIMLPNDFKLQELQRLEIRKHEISNLLK